MKIKIYKIGDIVEITQNSYHNSGHRWYKRPGSGRCKIGEVYVIDGVDIDSNYLDGYTLHINNTAYGSTGVKLLESIDLEEARRIIYED